MKLHLLWRNLFPYRRNGGAIARFGNIKCDRPSELLMENRVGLELAILNAE
jgi:hypothetical protein